MSIVDDILDMMASSEQAQQRSDICNTCDRNTLNVCLSCNCFIPTKVYYKLSVCPENKWTSIPIKQIY